VVEHLRVFRHVGFFRSWLFGTFEITAESVYGDDYFSGLTTIRFPVEAIR